MTLDLNIADIQASNIKLTELNLELTYGTKIYDFVIGTSFNQNFHI